MSSAARLTGRVPESAGRDLGGRDAVVLMKNKQNPQHWFRQVQASGLLGHDTQAWWSGD
jgi:hypothetical protein